MNRREFLNVSAAGGTSLLIGLPHLGAVEQEKKSKNRYLSGNYAPVSEEVVAERLTVIGKIPAGLQGMFVRNGPNPLFAPKGKYHWFDGDGMLHGIHIANGKASYRNRYVETNALKHEKAAGKALWVGLKESPAKSTPPKGAELIKNTSNTSVVFHHDRLLSLFEYGFPYEVDPKTLKTKSEYDFGGSLKHNFTAHPKIDVRTGELICFGYRYEKPPFIHYSVFNKHGKMEQSIPIEIDRPVMMHDFAITENYSIFMNLPMFFERKNLFVGKSPFQFEKNTPSRFGLVPRKGKNTKLMWFEAESCFVFHSLCAFEEGDDVVLLGCRYARFPQAPAFSLTTDKHTGKGRDPDIPYLHEWRFNTKTGATKERSLDDRPSEFPRINDRFVGQKVDFGYAMTDDRKSLVRFDLREGKSQRHSHGKGRLGEEGVFVEAAKSNEENDGWILSYVYDSGSNQSELVVIDAKDFSSKPIARIQLPVRVPFGFHGTWIPEKDL